MVRYHEIIKEDKYDDFYDNFPAIYKAVEAKLSQSYYTYGYESIEITAAREVEFITGNLVVIEGATELVDVPILQVRGEFDIENTNLTSLINSPHDCMNVTIINNQKLESLEGLPKKIRWKLTIQKTENLKSLKGIDFKSKINIIKMYYYSDLPLLRLLVATKIEMDNQEVNTILNYHIKNFSNVKERIIKCQYAMIKAGYKDNAKW